MILLYSVNLEEIVERIKEHPVSTKPIIIGVDGFGGSGKSTFAARLKAHLHRAHVVTVDDFVTSLDISDDDKSNFDRRRLERDVLIPAMTGKEFSYRQSLLKGDKLGGLIYVPRSRYLIIEGVSSYYPDIEKYYDYKIWINVPGDVASKRGALRDKKARDDGKQLTGDDELWEMWTKTYQQYKEKHRPDHRADFIYNSI